MPSGQNIEFGAWQADVLTTTLSHDPYYHSIRHISFVLHISVIRHELVILIYILLYYWFVFNIF